MEITSLFTMRRWLPVIVQKLAIPTLALLTVITVLDIQIVWGQSAEVSKPLTATIPLDLAKVYFDQARSLAASDDGKLWGLSLHGPMIFVDMQTRFAVANQADAQKHLQPVDGLWCGTLPADVQLANTSTEWAGVRWTMLLWNGIPQNRFARGRLLMHESLHRIQPALGFTAASPINAHLDSLSGRIWLRLEMRALAAALVHNDRERHNHIRAALLFRAIRRAECGGNSASEEDQLEANEGICEYTGFRLCGLPETVLLDRVAVELERSESSPTLTRSFAYTTGPALGLLLDQFEPDWRKTIISEPLLAARLAKAAALPPEQILREQATEIAKNYGWQEIFLVESERDTKRRARLEQLTAQYVTGRVLEIETGPNFQFSFDPNAAESLDAQRVVHKPVTASDDWGTLDARQGAMIDFRAPMKLVLPIPADATVDTVPWKIELVPAYELDTEDDRVWKIKKRN